MPHHNKLLALVGAVVSALLLSGCAAGGDAGDAAPAPAATSSASAADAGGEEAPGSEEEVSLLEAVEASYQLWLANGMTEEVTSSGDRYVLTYQPGGDFVAALYNLDFDDVIPIEQPELFTVYSAWMMLQDDATVVVEGDNQLSLSNESYGNFTVFIENGLIVSGEEASGAWTGVFRYEPDRAILELLDEALG